MLSPARDIAAPSAIEDELLHPRPIGDLSDAAAYEGEMVGPTILSQSSEAVVLTPDTAQSISVIASGTHDLRYDLLFGNNVIRSSNSGVFILHHTYRVYSKQRGRELIILLAGGDKRTQAKDIKIARRLARELMD